MRVIRAIFASMWLGWQRELVWTNPALALLIRSAGPIASVLGVALVYWYGSTVAGLFAPATLAFVMVGASLYAQVAAYAWVPTSAISEGKWTNVFPQVYITPTSSVPYLAGRCLASFASYLPITAISLGFAYYAANLMFATQVPLIVTPQSLLMVVAAFLANLPAALGLGFMLGCYSIFVSRFEWALPGYIAGTLMLFSEALFPASILPWPLSVIANALPFTYFMRGSRAALISGSWTAYTSNLALSLIGGLAFLAVGLAAYVTAEGAARRKGFIDRRPA